MTKRCCVPLCTTGRKAQTEYVSIFSLPKDPELRQIWEANIGRDKPLHHAARVCAIHFTKDNIINPGLQMPDGTIFISDRKPKLKPGSIPTIFPSLAKQEEDSTGDQRKKVVTRPGDRVNSNLTTLLKKDVGVNKICFVPFCKTNDRVTEIVRNQGGYATPHVFTTPQDPGLFKKWETAIGRSDARMSESSYVCCLHFVRSDYLQCVSNVNSLQPDSQDESDWGVVPALNVDAVPSIFPVLRVANFGDVNMDKLPPHDIRRKGLVDKDYIEKKYGSQALFENINKLKPLMSNLSRQPSGNQSASSQNQSSLHQSQPSKQENDRVSYNESEIIFDDECNQIIVKTEVLNSSDNDLPANPTNKNINSKSSNLKLVPLKSIMKTHSNLESGLKSQKTSRVLKEPNRQLPDLSENSLNTMDYSEGLEIIKVNPNCTCEQDSEPLEDTMKVQFERLESIMRRTQTAGHWICSFAKDNKFFVLVLLEDLENFVTKKKIIIDPDLKIKVVVAEAHVVTIEGVSAISDLESLKCLLRIVQGMVVCSSLLSSPINSDSVKFKCTGFVPNPYRTKVMLCMACKQNAKSKSHEQVLGDLRNKYLNIKKENKNLKKRIRLLQRNQARKIEKLKNKEITKIDHFMSQLERSLLSSDLETGKKKKKSKSKKENILVEVYSDCLLTSENEKHGETVETNSEVEGEDSMESEGEDSMESEGEDGNRSDVLKKKANKPTGSNSSGSVDACTNTGACHRLAEASSSRDDTAEVSPSKKRKKLDILERLDEGVRAVHEPVESYSNMKQMTINDSDGMLVLMIDPDIITVDRPT